MSEQLGTCRGYLHSRIGIHPEGGDCIDWQPVTAPAEYTCPRCESNVSTHICMAEPVAGETKKSTRQYVYDFMQLPYHEQWGRVRRLGLSEPGDENIRANELIVLWAERAKKKGVAKELLDIPAPSVVLDNPSGQCCPECRATGLLHCSDPVNCGGMRPMRPGGEDAEEVSDNLHDEKDTHLSCGHSKWDSKKDCLVCLNYVVYWANKRQYALNVTLSLAEAKIADLKTKLTELLDEIIMSANGAIQGAALKPDLHQCGSCIDNWRKLRKLAAHVLAGKGKR